MKQLIFTTLFILINIISYGKDIDLIRNALNNVDNRLSHGLLISDITNEKTFEQQVTLQIDIAFNVQNQQDKLTEDWFNLCLYCLSRKYKYYNLALKILKREYEIENYHKLRKWIKRRIDLLENPNFLEDNFNIENELNDLEIRVLQG